MTSQGGLTEEIVLMLRIDLCLMWWLCHSHLKIQTNPQSSPVINQHVSLFLSHLSHHIYGVFVFVSTALCDKGSAPGS